MFFLLFFRQKPPKKQPVFRYPLINKQVMDIFPPAVSYLHRADFGSKPDINGPDMPFQMSQSHNFQKIEKRA
jgi:hypothetical protein